MVDSLKIFEVLKAHLSEAQARSVTQAIQQAESQVTTDFRTVLREELIALRREMGGFATKAELADLRGELLAKIAETKAELIRWMFVFWIGQVAATVALVKLLR